MTIFRNIFTISSDSTRRIRYLDYVRGILMLSVLYHHSNAPFAEYILQFHMPALFILSGYTEFILNNQKPLKTYIVSKFYRLIIPYFCFEFINLLLFVLRDCIFGSATFSPFAALISIITCLNKPFSGLYGRLWFLPAIFVSSVFSYLIKRLCRNNSWGIVACCFLMTILSYVSFAFIPFRLPFAIDIAFLGTTFFLIGHFCGNLIQRFFASRISWRDLFLLAVSLLIFVGSNIVADPACYMYINQYNAFPYMGICALAGTVTALILVKFLSFILDRFSLLRELVLWYSVNSLAIFPIHLTIKVLSWPLLVAIGKNTWLCLFFLMLTLTIPIVNIITTYLPFTLGVLRPKKARKIV